MASNIIQEIYPSTKASILIQLTSTGTMTASQINHRLRNLNITYKTVYKALQELVKHGIVLKDGIRYSINPNTGLSFIELGKKMNKLLKEPDIVFIRKFDSITSQMIELRQSLGVTETG